MNPIDIARAWKDPEYRAGLSAAEMAALPAHPAGLIELTDEDLGAVVGGFTPQTGTGAAGCECKLTITAESGGGSCYCVCDVTTSID